MTANRSGTRKRKPGRPRKYGQGRINATVRFTPERHRDLKAAADDNRRSISEEVESRIEQLAHWEKLFRDERGMLDLLRAQTDDAIKAAARERKWGFATDPDYGGQILIPPGQHAFPQSHWVDLEAEAREKEAKVEGQRRQQQQFEEAIERAVTRALAKARLTIGGEGK